MPPTRNQLLRAAEALTADFIAQKPIADLVQSHFSTTHQVTALEHGDPALLPFVGRPHVGLHAVQGYFELLARTLKAEGMRFSEWVVDAEAARVSVKGEATWTWIEEGEGGSWKETFVWMLDFDEEAKVTDYQVWADTGAAYLARKKK